MDRTRFLLIGAIVLLILLVTVPLFFDIFATAAFNIHPRDDYGPYLQAIVGQGGRVPDAPMVYRLFSVLVAVPMYFLLPVYSFTNLTDIDPRYLQATEALAALSYISILASAGVIFLICRKHLEATVKSSLIVALLSLFFSSFTSEGVDQIAILIICVLLYLIDRPIPFAVVMLLSIGFNEKVAFLFVIIFALRLIVSRDRAALPLLGASLVAAIGYVAVRLAINAPGWENQMTPSTFLPGILATVPYFTSAKGLVTNIIPTVIIGVLAWVDLTTADRLRVDSPIWRRSDVLVFVCMLFLGMAIGMQFTVGRLVMFTYPLYLPLLSRWIDEWAPDPVRSAVT
jgi:hypothetical protein